MRPRIACRAALPRWALQAFVAAACVLQTTCASLSLDRRDWLEVEGGHFRIVSEIGREQTLELFAELDGFRRVVGKLLDAEPPQPRAPVRIFALRPDTYSAFGPRGSAGFFSSTPRGVFIALNAETRIAARGIIYHEYTHYMLSEASLLSYPRWYDEGLAEFLRGTAIGEDRAEIGLLLDDRVAELRGYGRTTLGSIVVPYATQFGAMSTTFYATSWALVHYLQLGFGQGMPDRRKQLVECLALLDRGVAAEEAFQTAFGVPIGQLDDEVSAYLERGRFSVAKVALPPSERVQPSVRRLATADALAGLGDLAQQTQTSNRAAWAYTSALRYRPDDARLLSGLARSLPRAKAERRHELVRQALEANGRDPVVQVNAGFTWLSEIVDDEGELDATGASGEDYERAFREARASFEGSLALCDDCAEAEAGLGILLLLPRGEVSEAREHLEAAARALPGHFPTQYALAGAYLRSGNPELARRILKRQLQNAHETRWMPRIARRLAEAEAAVRSR